MAPALLLILSSLLLLSVLVGAADLYKILDRGFKARTLVDDDTQGLSLLVSF